MPKIKYKNNTGNKSVKGGTLVPFHKEGNTTYFKVFANDPLKTDSVLVGPNNKNGIALDNNEIVKETKNHIEVASDDLGTVNVIENLSNRMPLPDAFRQGFIRQELYKNNNKTNKNKFVTGGENDMYAPIIMSNGREANMKQTNSLGELFYDITKARYEANRAQLKKRGYKSQDIDRLARIMTYQNNLEGGWVLNRSDNNWGGMREDGKTIKFDSLDSYYDNWFNMMNKRWPGWDKAKDYIEFANIVNHDDLGIKGEKEIEAYRNKYKKEHNGEQIYWYAPHYENNNRHYRDHLGDVYERSNYYMDILDKERKPEEMNDNTSATIQYAKQIAEALNSKQYRMPFDAIMTAQKQQKGQSNQPSFFTGGRTRMVDGGDKEIKADIEPAVVTAEKSNDNNKFYIRKRKIGNKIYYDVDGKLIDNEQAAYRYAGNIMKARGTIDMSNTLDASNVEQTRKIMPFDTTTFTVPNNDKLQDNRKVVIDSLKLTPTQIRKANKELDAIKYETSSYEDRPISKSELIGPILKKSITNDNKQDDEIKPKKDNKSKSITSSNKQNTNIDNTNNNIIQREGLFEILDDISTANPLAVNAPITLPKPASIQSPLKRTDYSIGKSGPSFIDKVRLGWDKFKSSMTPARAALLGSTVADVAGNIINAGIERNAIDSTRYVDAPIQHQASKLLTNYNINPQLDSIANSAANVQRNIEENTLSSKVAQNRLNMLGLNTSLNNNQLYAQKENTETQLINQDTMNQQSIRNSNIDSYNQWLAGKTEFDNNKILSKANATASAINGIGQTLGNLATGLLQEQQFNNNVELLKAMNPDAAKVVPAKCGGRYNKKRRK